MGTVIIMLISSHVSRITLERANQITQTVSHSSLSVVAPTNQSAQVFTGIFVLVWLGSVVVTVNGKLLGSKM